MANIAPIVTALASLATSNALSPALSAQQRGPIGKQGAGGFSGDATMRPTSEINSALELVQHELDGLVDGSDDGNNLTARSALAIAQLTLLRDALEWVMGSPVDTDGPNAWLVAYLLDDPPKLESYDPREN